MKSFSRPIDRRMTFGRYFMSRQLEELDGPLLESADPRDFKVAVKKVEKELRGSYIDRLYEKFTKIQYGDVEEAFDDAVAEVKKGRPRSEIATKKAIRKSMEKHLSDVNRKKKGVRKSLSCVQAVKASLGAGQSVSDIIRKAEKALTNQEKRVVTMCSEGKPVRKIAEEIGTSFPTAWRILNSALDKIRMSHGMRPRNLDIRRKSRK